MSSRGPNLADAPFHFALSNSFIQKQKKTKILKKFNAIVLQAKKFLTIEFPPKRW